MKLLIIIKLEKLFKFDLIYKQTTVYNFMIWIIKDEKLFSFQKDNFIYIIYKYQII